MNNIILLVVFNSLKLYNNFSLLLKNLYFKTNNTILFILALPFILDLPLIFNILYYNLLILISSLIFKLGLGLLNILILQDGSLLSCSIYHLQFLSVNLEQILNIISTIKPNNDELLLAVNENNSINTTSTAAAGNFKEFIHFSSVDPTASNNSTSNSTSTADVVTVTSSSTITSQLADTNINQTGVDSALVYTQRELDILAEHEAELNKASTIEEVERALSNLEQSKSEVNPRLVQDRLEFAKECYSDHYNKENKLASERNDTVALQKFEEESKRINK